MLKRKCLRRRRSEHMHWNTWNMQPELALLIRYYVDTGSAAGFVVSRILEDHPGKYTAAEVSTEIARLTTLFLLVADPQDGYLKVTEWAHDTAQRAIQHLKRDPEMEWDDCLKFLLGRGVWHPDMVQYRLVAKEETPV
jgi:hypothetical protein